MKTFIFKFDLDTAHVVSEWAVYEDEGYYCSDCRAFVPGDFEAELLDYEISPIDEADEYYQNEIENLDIEQFIEDNNLWERFIAEYRDEQQSNHIYHVSD